jgi:hypothetical protein
MNYGYVAWAYGRGLVEYFDERADLIDDNLGPELAALRVNLECDFPVVGMGAGTQQSAGTAFAATLGCTFETEQLATKVLGELQFAAAGRALH